jgi:hypothetical protein
MFKSAITSKFFATDAGYYDLGRPVNVLAFFQGPQVKIVGFSQGCRQYRVTSQNLQFQKTIGQYIWLGFSITSKDKASNRESQFVLFFNPAQRQWRLSEE